MLGAKFHACLANRKDLRMRGWVMSLGNAVRALGQDLTIPDDHRRERPTALCDVLTSDVDGALREVHGTTT